MNRKKTVYSELLYCIGIPVVSLGSAMMVKADLGVETVVAPAYVLHLQLSRTMPFVTLGVSSFVYGCALVLLMMAMTHRFQATNLFAVAASFVSSAFLDLWAGLLRGIPYAGLAAQGAMLTGGIAVCSVGIGLCFFGYFPPAPYELFVKGLSQGFGWRVELVKTGFDIFSCLLAAGLSFLFFGKLRGIHVGTLLCAFVSGAIVGWVQRQVQQRFVLQDAFRLRSFFGN